VTDPDMSKDDVIRPVSTPEHIEKITPKDKGDFYSRCVFLLAIIIGLAAFVLSAIAFAGFAENDQNPTHLLSALSLSFGIGALAFGPMIVVAFFARNAIHAPMPAFRALIVILLMLPWFVLCYFIFKIGDIWRLVAILAALTALFVSIWAARFLNPK